VLCALAGCSPSASTIDGHDAAQLGDLADRAGAMCRERSGRTPPRPFTTDGCTLTPDGPWQSCCVEHDMVYWCGGSADVRRRADEIFRACVTAKGTATRGAIYYHAVRFAAAPWLPFPWRWGYGWPWQGQGE
jgi:hypothetical protein